MEGLDALINMKGRWENPVLSKTNNYLYHLGMMSLYKFIGKKEVEIFKTQAQRKYTGAPKHAHKKRPKKVKKQRY